MSQAVLTESAVAYPPVVRATDRYLRYDDFAPSFGLDEKPERFPVYVKKIDGALGATYFSPGMEPSRVEINPETRNDDMDMVVAHEFDHVKSSPFLKYMDLAQPYATLIAEGYPGLRRYKFLKKTDEKEAMEFVGKYPYKEALYLAKLIDNNYRGERGNGYAGFIKDVRNEKSICKVFSKFLEQYRETARLN